MSAQLLLAVPSRPSSAAELIGRLRWQAPPGAMTVDLLRQVKAAEAAILARLAAEAREAADGAGEPSADGAGEPS